MSRFDYVRYDETAQVIQNAAKDICSNLENLIDDNLRDGRSKSLALTKLEETYMWIGKAIRDDQVQNRAAELQEERLNA